MKKIFSILLVACMLVAVCCGLLACSGDTPGSTTPSSTTPSTNLQDTREKLNSPTVALAGNTVIWTAEPKADRFEISIDGTLSYVENTVTSKVLSNGQNFKIRAIGDGVNYLTSDWSNTVTYEESGIEPKPDDPKPTKLVPPVVSISQTGVASWSAVSGAQGYVYKINGGIEVTIATTSIQLSSGQSIEVKAVGDGVNYVDSDYSASKIYTSTTPPSVPSGDAPAYLGILASTVKPNEGVVPDSILPRVRKMVRSARSFNDALNNHFSDSNNYIGNTYPSTSSYDAYSRAGETVYVQIWLNNPEQYTILSLMLNGTKYQVGGGLSSFFVVKDGDHYNCVYVAVTIPSNTYVEKSYTVTNIEYISNTFINPDGTDEFMNDNDTVTIGLPYSSNQPSVPSLEPSSVTTNSYEAEITVNDIGRIVEQSSSWLGFAIYDGEKIIHNQAVSVGSNTISVDGLAEDTEYTVIVYILGDLHDGEGVRMHTVSEGRFTTQSAIDYFEVEADYYSKWGYPEIGEEPDSGLSINVSLYLTSNTATYDRLELYKGGELVYTNNEFAYSETIEDLLADTEYTVKIYFSDTDYSEHYVEKTVTTGRMDKPEMNLQGKYSFVKSALFTFDLIENGYLRQAIAKNIRVEIYRGDIWQLEYKNWILKLCDDPELYDRTQAEFDEAIENGDWGLANKIDHESLTFLRNAKDIINSEELGSFGTDRSAWEEYFNTVSRTFYLDTEDFFGSYGGATLAHLVFRDYFSFFSEDAQYKIFADVDMKDGRGFVETEIGDGSIRNIVPINHENNEINFDCEIDGMSVKVNPYFRVNYEDNRILVVSYEIGLYTNNGTLVDTLYTSKEVNWQEFDEDAWIDAYIRAMKGEAILPSEEQIIKEFGWRAIFEIMLNIEFDFEDDFTGGGNGEVVAPGGDIVVDGNGSVEGKGEKNIANERERQILRELLAYDYPADYEYDLKTSMLEAFMQDEFYWDLINGIDDIDSQLEALIAGALNSSIRRVLGACESGIYHFMTWQGGTVQDEIYIGFKTVIESYLEDTGKAPEVNWQESYRRIMMFEDFYAFYPFGYVESFEIELEDGKYPTGEYMIGIKYRYDSYEEDRYETRYNYYQTVKITGKLPLPSFNISEDGYLESFRADVENFWQYHFEVEIKDASGDVIFRGNPEEMHEGAAVSRLLKDYAARARTVFNDGATSDLYRGDSEWTEWFVYAGRRLEKPNLEYDSWNDSVKWYAERGEVSHFLYIINDGVAINVPTKNGDYSVILKYGDTLKVKAVPTDGAMQEGYVESEWAEYVCEDTREMLATPTIKITWEGKEAILEWDSVLGANRYVLEITRGGETYTREEYGTTSYGQAGATYRVRAMSGSSEVRSSTYSSSVTFSVKLANPLFKSATADMIRWQSGDSYTQGYYYKIGENGEVQTTNRPILYFKDLTVNSGDIIYVQAYADGCESSDWVVLYQIP